MKGKLHIRQSGLVALAALLLLILLLPPIATGAPTESAVLNSGSAAKLVQECDPAKQAQFSDVPQGHTFRTGVDCLSCRGVISGYADGTYKPSDILTRGQLVKMVARAAGFSAYKGEQLYEDVPTNHPFFPWINRLSEWGYVGGYACGGSGEPCRTGNRPYFRPYAAATRGHTAKLLAHASRLVSLATPTSQTFADVPRTHELYKEIELLGSRGIVSGYGDAQGRSYFLPDTKVSRGQAAKMVAGSFFPSCYGR